MPPRYSYKNITSCDVCSQIMKGNTRQGLKCKLCRMNVHPECQDRVVKCQPKAKFSRMKSGSEMGDDEREMSIDYVCKAARCVSRPVSPRVGGPRPAETELRQLQARLPGEPRAAAAADAAAARCRVTYRRDTAVLLTGAQVASWGRTPRPSGGRWAGPTPATRARRRSRSSSAASPSTPGTAAAKYDTVMSNARPRSDLVDTSGRKINTTSSVAAQQGNGSNGSAGI